ncbi:NADH dehydrogenase [ubiquinone] 1 alpha subcomplex subunit 9, mitochondrial [Amphibalanus amphitrite]|uniref:NADH dehydrogenase [ubiquinone] 1 alpha subcomplex subunit 9, mitochondrial n=1 Tax=Amphibalanus amphitrite TaxID=1232801 RepID=A0A6A4WV08_AMPAM|nr:NADH dehydrogenase [ubiquinone] 1 alpha subcomplex subunit 9, mitochondrial [Amphibalanus amphitrite]
MLNFHFVCKRQMLRAAMAVSLLKNSSGLLGVSRGALSAAVRPASTGGVNVAQAGEVEVLPSTRLTDLPRGRGGRSSFSGQVVTVFGGTGFLGRYVVNRLGKTGSQIVATYRGDDYDVRHLKLAGDLGQVVFCHYSLKDMDSIRKAVRHSNIVINLVGRDFNTWNFKFDDVNNVGARAIARACREAGVKTLVHFSALNAAENPEGHVLKGGSQFLKSKWRGEMAVREEFPDAVVFRPADMFGQEDRFTRYFVSLTRHQGKWMPLYRKGEHTIKQPVFVGDVARAVEKAIRSPDSAGETYEALGPRRYQLSELVDWFHRVIRKKSDWGYMRYDMKWDPFLMLRARANEMICPSWPIGTFVPDKVERECVTDQPTGVPTLSDLGVPLTTMEERIMWELKPFKAGAYYEEQLDEFEKPAPPRVAV